VKKEVRRERKLRAYTIDIATLQSLVDRAASLFENGDMSYSINITVNKADLTFENFDELRTYGGLPLLVRDFTVYIHNASHTHSIRLSSYSFLGSTKVTASSSSEAWCAGAVEIVYEHLRSHANWYWPVLGWPVLVMWLLVFTLPVTAKLIGRNMISTQSSVGAWMSMNVCAYLIAVNQRRIFPPATLLTAERRNTIRQWVPEITLFVTFLALVFTIIGVLKK
jgi:hypothetical protein